MPEFAPTQQEIDECFHEREWCAVFAFQTLDEEQTSAESATYAFGPPTPAKVGLLHMCLQWHVGAGHGAAGDCLL